MKTIEQVIEIFGGKPEDWERHNKGDGWKQKTARVDATAYLGPNVIVYGDAQVSGNAWVYGDAQVSGNARVYGDAQVSGNARVYGDAWEKTPLQIHGTRHAARWVKKGVLGIGCHHHEIEYWRKNYKQIGKNAGYSESEIKEYGRYIRFFWLMHQEELKAVKK